MDGSPLAGNVQNLRRPQVLKYFLWYHILYCEGRFRTKDGLEVRQKQWRSGVASQAYLAKIFPLFREIAGGAGVNRPGSDLREG